MVTAHQSLQERFASIAWAFLLASSIVIGLLLMEWTENRRFLENQRRSVVEQLSTIRARLEGELNAELLLARSIITEVATNTDITEATIDETLYFAGVFEYLAVRGSTFEYGKMLVTNQSPFTLDPLEKHGNAGISFDITETAGVGTLNYTSDSSGSGTLRYKFLKFED